MHSEHDSKRAAVEEDAASDTYVAGVLRRIIALSEDMLTAARDGQWPAVNEKETERQRLVWGIFATHPGLAECDRSRDQLLQVHVLSERLVALAEAERLRAGESSANARQARRVHQAYAEQMG